MFSSSFLFGQEAERSHKEVIYKRESGYFLDLGNSSWGFGFRYGNFKTGYSKKTWDFSFSFIHDLKEYKQSSIGSSFGNRYYFGKQYFFYGLRILRGNQKVLFTKPYWGGIEIRRFLYGGVNLGLAKPVYLYINNFADGNSLTLEKYDPDKHDYQDINGKGPFSKGLNEIKLHPALTLKGGFSFEYGTFSEKVKAIDIGAIVDVYAVPVQIMAYKNPSYVMLGVYLSFHFGKRYNP